MTYDITIQFKKGPTLTLIKIRAVDELQARKTALAEARFNGFIENIKKFTVTLIGE